MTYQEALKYLESFINYEKVEGYNYKSSLKLERMKRFAALLGDPQKYTKSIHIAGTKGKGSTAAFVHSVLRSAGFKAGLYTSPHLVDFRERIRINEELVSEKDLSMILGNIRDAVESSMNEDRPSFFEVYTMIAYIYFKQNRCDFAVYEVGLGGRLDATNLIDPVACAITPLSYEHTDKLGSTLKEIATEKCGIIKSGSICVSAPQDKEALKVIESICMERNARLILVGRDITFKELNISEDGEIFNLSGTLGEYANIRIRLLGSHQVVNAATAIGVIEAMHSRGVDISNDAIMDGLELARWPGRLEIMARTPYVVVDGAQNGSSAEALAGSLKKIFKYKRLILILGVSRDKDLERILERLLPISDMIVFTKSRVTGRAMDPENIKIAAEKTGITAPQIKMTGNAEDAIKEALSAADKGDLILATGSLFIVGEIKDYFAKKDLKECARTQ